MNNVFRLMSLLFATIAVSTFVWGGAHWLDSFSGAAVECAKPKGKKVSV